MTIATFLFSLLGAMALGAPVAFALLICGVALMIQMNNFDTQASAMPAKTFWSKVGTRPASTRV